MSLQHENPAVIAVHGHNTVTLNELLRELKYQTLWHVVGLAIQRLVISDLISEHKITIDEDAVYDYMNVFREERDLFSEEEITIWLEQNKLDDSEFFDLCEFEASKIALKERLFNEDKVTEVFAYKKLEMDAIELYHIITPTRDLADEILAQTKEGENFFEMARKLSIDEETRKSCGYMGWVKRSELRAEIEAAVFNSPQGSIVGPFKGSRGFHLYFVDEKKTSVLDELTRQQIIDELFADFVVSKMCSSDIQYQV